MRNLTQKLQEELKFEQESAAEDAFSPAFLQTFKEDGIWTVRLFPDQMLLSSGCLSLFTLC